MEGSPATIIMKQAGKLLARRAYSRGELREKLGGLAEAAALEPVLDLLEQQKLLNDNEYAYNFALYRIGNYGWGPARVYAALLRRLVPPPIIDAALERVRGELGRTAPLVDYIGKRCGKKRAAAHG